MKRFLTLTLAMLMLLSCLCGCTQEKTGADASESMTTPAGTSIDAGAVVARVNGAEILYGQVAQQMASVQAMYQSLAGTLSAEEIMNKLEAEARNVVNKLIDDAILDQKIAEYGLTLTKEEETQAKRQWDAVLENIRGSLRVNYPTMSEEDLDAMVVLTMQNSAISQDMVLSAARKSILTEKLRAAAAEGMQALSENDIQTLYDSLLEEQKAKFDSDPTAFEAAMLGKTVVVYIPRNYRVIQELTVKSSDDVIGLLKQMAQYDNEESNSYEEMLYNEQAIQQKLMDSVRNGCAAGESFAEVCRSVVPGIALKTNYICAATTRFSEAYYNAAMGIPEEGGLADALLPADYGCTLLCWEKSLPAGQIPLEEVREVLSSQLEKEREGEYWKLIRQQWLEEADVTIFEELLAF